MSREHAIPRTHLFLETSSLWVGVEAAKRKVITAYLLNLRRRFEPASAEQKRKLLNRDNASACANASAQEKNWENKTTDLYAAVVSRHSWLAKQTPYHAPTQAKKNVVRFEKLTALFFTRWYRENAAWRQAKTLSPLFEMIRKLEPKCVPQLRLGSLQRTHWSAIGQCSYLSSRFAHVPSCIARQYQGLPA